MNHPCHTHAPSRARAWVLALMLTGIGFAPGAWAAKCLYISSYHAGYEWNDGIERGLDKRLGGHCQVDKFYLDTQHNPAPAFSEEMALKAKAYIEQTKPDVVIACDDAASKYLVKPYYKDAALPIIFCGVNWNVDAYGYPYRNVTGIVEISPIKPLMKEIQATLGKVHKGVYIGPDTISQRKEAELNSVTYAKADIEIQPVLVNTVAEWENAYRQAQSADFIILGNNGGISDWDDQRVYQFVSRLGQKLTVTNYDWMSTYAMLAMTKIAEEQGEWSAETALAILAGKSPTDIPIVVNRRWQIYVNPALLEHAKITLPADLVRKGIKVKAP